MSQHDNNLHSVLSSTTPGTKCRHICHTNSKCYREGRRNSPTHITEKVNPKINEPAFGEQYRTQFIRMIRGLS
jgi:hypothetical protein